MCTLYIDVMTVGWFLEQCLMVVKSESYYLTIDQNETFENAQWRKAKQKCNQCYLAFIQASDLRSHFKMHSGEK